MGEARIVTINERAGGRFWRVPHSIAFCAIEWSSDAACNSHLPFTVESPP
jgi:hypothetical protein